MEVLIERACGLDVHKKSITACIVTPDGKEIKTFRTHTVYLMELIDWINARGCSHVAMESTGVFWKPIVNLLEAEDIEFLVVNAQHIALRGNMSAHQRLMLKAMLTHIDFLNEQIVDLDTEVAKRLDPFQEQLDRLETIPGIARRTAEQILAEIGTDVGARFPSAAHLCSWIGLVPRHNESAGKRKPSKTRKGNKYLRAALTEAAQSI